MNNFLAYFYNINVDKIKFKKDYYYFMYNGYLYRLYILDKNTNINFLISLNQQLLNITLISEIIMNKDNSYLSFYNNYNYLLLKIFVNTKKKITLNEICYFDNLLYSKNVAINWGMLWSKKIDYLENLIKENGKKYPLIVDSFNYFVGMAENAISYFNKIIIPKNYICYLSHKYISFDNSSESFYNPLNIIYDYRSRDIAEYIKFSFFDNNYDIFNELKNSLSKNNLSLVDIKLIIARILYPSFYFNLYESIIIYNENEKILINIISKLNVYEKYLSNIINFFKKYYDIEEINWLK